MRLPNKTTPFEESVFVYFLDILNTLKQNTLPVLAVYEKVSRKNKSLSDFLDALDCLYALGSIRLKDGGVLEYVEKN